MGDEIVVDEVTPKVGMTEILDSLDDDSSDDKDDKESSDEIKLEDDSDDEESEDEKESEEEASDEEESEEEDEDELEIKDDEDKEFEYQEVPNRKAILAKFPDLFKTFPGIERAIYREDQYTKVFPSIQEAKDARQQLEGFIELQKDLFNGDVTNLLTQVHKTDAKAFNKIADQFLGAINKVDNAAFLKIANKVIKTALANVAVNGKKMKERGHDRGEQYELAAQYLHEAIYGDPEISLPETEKEEKEDPKVQEVTRREKELNERELSRAVNDVSSSTTATIKKAVEKYIDPKGFMSDYVRGKAVSDVMASLDKDLNTDTRFRQHLDRLWLEAQKANYSDESRAKIRKAIISKAQTSLKDHIKHVRSQALKNSTNRTVVRNKSEREKGSGKEKLTPSRNSNNTSRSDIKKPSRLGGVANVMKLLE